MSSRSHSSFPLRAVQIPPLQVQADGKGDKMCTLYYQFDSFCCMKQGLRVRRTSQGQSQQVQRAVSHSMLALIIRHLMCGLGSFVLKKGGDYPGLKNSLRMIHGRIMVGEKLRQIKQTFLTQWCGPNGDSIQTKSHFSLEHFEISVQRHYIKL